MKSGFTLIELIVAIVIIGILVALALPLFPKAMETTRAQEAKAALKQIWTAERIYRTKEDFYYPHHTDAPNNPETDEATINSFLKLFLDTREKDWQYQVETSVVGGIDKFTATATRKGKTSNNTITIDQGGVIDETGWSP